MEDFCELKIYTDGSQSSKTLDGGWAIVLDTNTYYYDQVPNTTNNRMELTAVLRALQFFDNLFGPDATFTKLKFNPVHGLTIYTDSAYIANCFKDKWYETWCSNGWKTSGRKDVANRDLWEQILNLYHKIKTVKIEKVEGHADVKLNNLADSVAVLAREGKLPKQENHNEYFGYYTD